MSALPGPLRGLGLAARFARRELRSGLVGFRVFLACLTLGVAAIAGVGSVSESLLEGLRVNGRSLLGGDLELRLTHREATEQQRAWLEQRATVSELASLRAMARGPDDRVLVELRAADDNYPLYGQVRLDPPLEPGETLADRLAERDGAWGAVVDPNLLRRLGVEIGETVTVGEARFALRGELITEPDKASRGFVFGPTFLAAREALRASGLEQPGSLIRYHYRLALPEGETVAGLRTALNETFPEAGWRIRDTGEAAPGLGRFIGRLTQFLTLVGLTTLLVGGVGVGNAVRGYLEGRSATIATFKCLGAPSRLVFQTYLIQILTLASLGTAIGLIIGGLAPLVVNQLLADRLGFEGVAGIFPLPLLLAAAFGLLTALAFSLWPLARAKAIPAARLFRDRVAPTAGRIDRPALLGLAATGIALAGLAILSANDRFLAAAFVAGAAGVLVAFHYAARGMIAAAARLPRPRRPGLRLAIANLTRPGSPAASVVMSLGLGLTVLVAIALIEGNLARWVRQSLPEEAPGFYFIDIQPDQIEPFRELVLDTPGVTELKSVPMLRGRISAVNGVPPDQLDVPSEIGWIFRGDRGLTWSAEQPENADVVAGEWWEPDYDGPPLVSLDAEVGEGLGIGPGDRLSVNLLGRDIEVTIANLRRIDWSDLTINFVMVFSPGLLEQAPQSHIATVKASPEAEDRLEIAVTDTFPNVSAIRVKEAVEAFSGIIGQVAVAVRSTASVALLAGVLVLAGAIAAGQQRRIYDAVVLKVLGATRRMTGLGYLFEFGLLGLATALLALVFGTLAAWLVLTEVMELPFGFLPATAFTTAAAAVAVTALLGFAGTWRALSQKAAPLLRNE